MLAPCFSAALQCPIEALHRPTSKLRETLKKVLVGDVLEATDLVIGVLELDVEFRHCLVYRLERLYNIAEDDWLPFKLLIITEALSVDKLHLFQDRGFS